MNNNRPFWRKRTNWGLILYAVGQVMQVIPVIAKYSAPVITIGTILAGYGIAHRIDKK